MPNIKSQISTIRESLCWAGKKLRAEKIISANLDAEILLSFVLKKPREFLYAHDEKILTPRQFSLYKKLINQRAKYVPVAYLTNSKEFFGLNFYVDKHVLIPRPETELLVEEVLKIIKNNNEKKLTVADIGAGSGCVAISIAKNSSARVLAADVSSAALKIAKQNARLNKVSKKIKFFRGDLLTPLRNKKINIVAANLPYLDNALKKSTDTTFSKSIKYEPRLALLGGIDGTTIYQHFLQQISQLKYRPQFVLIEIGSTQNRSLTKFIKKILPRSNTETLKDLNNKNRVIVVTT